jgi:capsular exopolysaccharide synthesis family protein
VLESAIARANLDITPEALEERLTVVSPATTQLLEITAEASDPEAARDLANVVSETFIDSNQSALANRPGIVSIVERAQAPLEPSAPSPALNAIIGAFLAFAATAGIVTLTEYLDDTVKDDESVSKLTGLPVVGHVAQFSRPGRPGEQLRAGVDPTSREAEAYRSMRTNVTFGMGDQQGVKRLLFTSPGPGEGKSTTAANLAVVFGLAGSRVLVVDADLRRPSQHRIFGLPNSSGLTNVLANSGVSLEQAVQRTAHERVWVLPSGPIPANPSELLGSGRMNSLLAAVEPHFDIIILDAPPVLAVTDPAVLSSVVSASVVVVQHGKTRSNELKSAVQRLAVAGKPIAGIVINRVGGSQAGYYYGDYGSRQEIARRGADQKRASVPRAVSPQLQLSEDRNARPSPSEASADHDPEPTPAGDRGSTPG